MYQLGNIEAYSPFFQVCQSSPSLCPTWQQQGPSLAQLPHPLPLQPGLWLPVIIQGVEPNCPAVHLHCRLMDPDTVFTEFREELARSLHTAMPQVRRIEAGHMAAARRFAKPAGRPAPSIKRVKPENMRKGDAVLAYYEDGRWDRLLCTTP